MKIITKCEGIWNGRAYVTVYEETMAWHGPVALACGPSGAESAIGQSQQNFMTQLQTQAGSVFGSSSQVFNSLMNTFSPIVAAGPNQQGFSPALLANLNSQAITQTGQAYQNAKAAVGNQLSAEGGGNVALPSGSTVGANLSLAESAANETSKQLSQITQENYATGRQNYEQAVQGMEAAPGVFNAATGAANAATNAGTAAANTANQIAQQRTSWMQPVIGALSGIAGAATGGMTNMLTRSITGPGWAGLSAAQNAVNGSTSNLATEDPGSTGYIGE